MVEWPAHQVKDMPKTLISFCVTASLALAACGSTGGGAVALKASPDRPDTRVIVGGDRRQAVVEIFSPGGIGGAEVEITSAALPQTIALRLHLRGLEDLRFTYSGITITTSLSSAGGPARQTYQSGGQEQAIAEGSPYWMSVRLVSNGGSPAAIPLQDGYIEVEVPRDFLARGQTKFAIKWIDFYR
jgi:hypothetical protein